MGLGKWCHKSDLLILDVSVLETTSRWSGVVFEQLLKTLLIGSSVPLMYGRIQKPLTASVAVVDDC